MNTFKQEQETTRDYSIRLSKMQYSIQIEMVDYYLCEATRMLEEESGNGCLNVEGGYEDKYLPKASKLIELVCNLQYFVASKDEFKNNLKKHPIDARIYHDDLDAYDSMLRKVMIGD